VKADVVPGTDWLLALLSIFAGTGPLIGPLLFSKCSLDCLPGFLLANVLLGLVAVAFGFWFFRLFKEQRGTPRYFASVGIVMGAIVALLSLPILVVGWF
jgi:hypothetical protein